VYSHVNGVCGAELENAGISRLFVEAKVQVAAFQMLLNFATQRFLIHDAERRREFFEELLGGFFVFDSGFKQCYRVSMMAG
jgi:hypothetical protein